MLHAAYQKCNTNCFNARASPRSPFSQHQQQQWICINDEACCLSLSHSLFRYLSHTLTLSPLCSRKQMKKQNRKNFANFVRNFLWKLKMAQSCLLPPPFPGKFAIFHSISFCGRKWIYDRNWNGPSPTANSTFSLVMSSGVVLTAHQIADCHLIAPANAWNRY